MWILGLNPTGPNTSACIIDSESGLVAFAEEERFRRVKLASDVVPTRAARFCLNYAGLQLSDIDRISVGWDHSKYPTFMRSFYQRRMSHSKKNSFSEALEEWRLASMSAENVEHRIKLEFWRNGIGGAFPPLVFVHHHLSHAASVFYPSPFEQSLILVVDGSGEELATSIWVGTRGSDLELLHSHELPDSLGYFYAALTEFLGFSIFTGEGKVMGMAPFGNPNKEFRNALSKFLRIDETGHYTVDPTYVYFGKRSSSQRHTDELADLLGINARVPESPITQEHYDLAFETQHALETCVLRMVRHYVNATGIRNVCIAGGVANNCKMNGVIADDSSVNSCFVIPASADSGVAYGSALVELKKIEPTSPALIQRFSAYQGPGFSNDEVIDALKDAKVTNYSVLSSGEAPQLAASLIAAGQIVGWFQGRMEVGARALGNRSILANPTTPGIKDRLNAEVKRRERFRPFAPSILEHRANEWLDLSNQSSSPLETHRWMIQAAKVRPEMQKLIPGVVHVDGSVRPQLVSQADNPKYFQLISEFELITGVPVVLNTSLNVRGEPIICKPEEAIRLFYSHGLDAIFIGDIVLCGK